MINIAIDGFAGSGKGTVSEGLAKHFNLKHLDTGAIFRSMAVAFSEINIFEPTEIDIQNYIDKIDIKIEFDGNNQIMFVSGKDVTSKLRASDIALLSSKVSSFPLARKKYEDIAREFAKNYDCVIDGRDITTVLLPNADVKIYLQADLNVRAGRRFKEYQTKNVDTTLDSVTENIKARDYNDANKGEYSTRITKDAIVIDNTNLSIDETNELVIKLVTERLGKLGKLK